ncbi:hypothetical protein FGB62_58g032 [Gracilaria domingensis]|nr:hypothetical protein FGB62_58g032 [Gracilaria domingensis]
MQQKRAVRAGDARQSLTLLEKTVGLGLRRQNVQLGHGLDGDVEPVVTHGGVHDGGSARAERALKLVALRGRQRRLLNDGDAEEQVGDFGGAESEFVAGKRHGCGGEARRVGETCVRQRQLLGELGGVATEDQHVLGRMREERRLGEKKRERNVDGLGTFVIHGAVKERKESREQKQLQCVLGSEMGKKA